MSEAVDTPEAFIDALISFIEDEVTPVAWEVPDDDESSELGVSGKGKVVYVVHSNLDDQSLAEWMDDWMRRFGFRCTLHGPGIRYSFVHDELTHDYQSLRNLLPPASPKDDNNNNDKSKASVGYVLPMSSKPSTTGSLPELPSIASSKNDDSRTLNLQMKPTSLGCRDDLLASNNRAIFILVEARPSKLCELGMVLKGGGCGFRPKFVKLRRQFVVPSDKPDLYHENVTVVSKNAVKLKEGDILHRVDECEMHPIMQHESKMKALKLVVGKAGEEGRSISLLFVRYLDTASGNTMIDDNNDDIIDFNVGIVDDWDKEDTVEGEEDEVMPGEGKSDRARRYAARTAKIRAEVNDQGDGDSDDDGAVSRREKKASFNATHHGKYDPTKSYTEDPRTMGLYALLFPNEDGGSFLALGKSERNTHGKMSGGLNGRIRHAHGKFQGSRGEVTTITGVLGGSGITYELLERFVLFYCRPCLPKGHENILTTESFERDSMAGGRDLLAKVITLCEQLSKNIGTAIDDRYSSSPTECKITLVESYADSEKGIVFFEKHPDYPDWMRLRLGRTKETNAKHRATKSYLDPGTIPSC